MLATRLISNLKLSRNYFLQNTILKNPTHIHPVKFNHIKFFATDKDLLKQFKLNQIERISHRDDRANTLITAIREKKYDLAKSLVQNGVNVNSHNKGENTPLTDAAERGDTDGVRFLLKDLKANPHASCDCPHHKTALHYASENGHIETVAELLKLGAQPNVLDSRKYTAIDVAKTERVKEVLIAKGGYVGKAVLEDKVKSRLYLPK